MLEVSLRHYGYEVSTALNGEEGHREARKNKPDLVILDIMMPGKSGLEVMYEMRKDPKTSDIPIIFLSAVSDESMVVQGLKGAEDYVLKPLKFLELLTRIEKIFERAGEKAGFEPMDKGEEFDRLCIQHGKETSLILLEFICFLEANGRYCFAHTRNGKSLVNYSIGELEERLSSRSTFQRIHRSHILNIDCIHKVSRDERGRLVVIIDDESRSRLTISATYLPQVESRLGL